MRKFSLVVAAVVALGLAMAPGVEAASADRAAAAQQVLQAIAAADPTTDAATVAELLGSGINPTAITGLVNLAPPSAYDSFLQGFSVPSGQTPTGTSLAPLTSQLCALPRPAASTRTRRRC